MISLNTSKNKTLEFEVQIQGINKEDIDGVLRFNLNNIEYGFPAEIHNESIKVFIPPLNEVIKKSFTDGEIIDGRLECTGNGFLMKTWEGQFEVKIPVQIETKLVEKEEEKEGERKEDIKVIKTKLVSTSDVPDKMKTIKRGKKEIFDDEPIEPDITNLKIKKEGNVADMVKARVQKKMEYMSDLVNTTTRNRKILESSKPKPKKKIIEKKITKPKKVQSINEVKQVLSGMGIRNERIQEVVLNRAIMMSTNPKDFEEVLRNVEQFIKPNKQIGDFQNVSNKKENN